MMAIFIISLLCLSFFGLIAIYVYEGVFQKKPKYLISPVSAGISNGDSLMHCGGELLPIDSFTIGDDCLGPNELSKRLFMICGDSADPFDIHDGDLVYTDKSWPAVGDLMVLKIKEGTRKGEFKLRMLESVRESEKKFETLTFVKDKYGNREEHRAEHDYDAYLSKVKRIINHQFANNIVTRR